MSIPVIDLTSAIQMARNENNSIIKVIGVGGGGGNAVTHMYKEGIKDVSFVLCNTDNQALERSPIPHKIQLGRVLTQGLGAGNKPAVAEAAAQESIEDIRNMLKDNTKMVFITAGMGGGTGTGAAPVVAQVAMELDILTIGIVTIPFQFEGMPKIEQALEGVKRISDHVDALLVINNEQLFNKYPGLRVSEAFAKADETLTNAARSIAEIITIEGKINLDFADVQTTLKAGGVAIMSTGNAAGEERILKAIETALHSPLLNNNDLYNAKKILFNIYYSKEFEPTMQEMTQVRTFMSNFSRDIDVIWGLAEDESLADEVKVTILATGFSTPNVININKEDDRPHLTSQKANNAWDSITQIYKQEPNIVLLSAEQLFDEDIISFLESHSPCQRENSEIARLGLSIIKEK